MTTPTRRLGHTRRTAAQRSLKMHGRRERRAATDGGLPTLEQTRQVLVDGAGAPALAVAALLRQSGHDPVLVDAPAGRPASPVTTLWPPGLCVLDAVGVGDTVRDAGRPLDALTVRTASGGSGTRRTFRTDGEAATPVMVDTAVFRDALGERVSEVPRLSTRVAAVAEHEDALEVEFENGVREFFDLVVTTGDAASTSRHTPADDVPERPHLSAVEVSLDADAPVPVLPTDYWQDGVAVQLLPPPSADAGGVLRLLATTDVAAALDAAATVAAAFPDAADGATATWTAALEGAEWTSVPRADVDAAGWASGRVAYCGAAAFPAPRLTAVQPALAFEDAWVLADELAGSPDDVAASLAAYARRRRHRLQTVFRRLSSGAPSNEYPRAQTAQLGTTSRLRATALASLCAPGLTELQRNVPARL